MDYSEILPLVYTYLGYRKIEKNDTIDQLIEKALEEIEEISSFRYIYQEFDEMPEFLRKPAYLEYLSGGEGFYLSAMTLGIAVDRRIRYYEKTDMTYMCVFDAASSAYLEYKSDEFERSLRNDLGYRFCPGYSGTDVGDIRPIYEILHAEKIGITLLESNLMVPEKSMIGIVGIGNKRKKSCGTCFLGDACKYRKEGRTCYQK